MKNWFRKLKEKYSKKNNNQTKRSGYIQTVGNNGPSLVDPVPSLLDPTNLMSPLNPITDPINLYGTHSDNQQTSDSYQPSSHHLDCCSHSSSQDSNSYDSGSYDSGSSDSGSCGCD